MQRLAKKKRVKIVVSNLMMMSFEFTESFDDSTNMKKNEKNVKNVKKIDIVVMIKTLFEKKNRKIIDFKKRVSHALKNDFNISNI